MASALIFRHTHTHIHTTHTQNLPATWKSVCSFVCECVCVCLAGNQFALWLQLLIFDTSKDFINCHLCTPSTKKGKKKGKRKKRELQPSSIQNYAHCCCYSCYCRCCCSDFGNLFWPFTLPAFTHVFQLLLPLPFFSLALALSLSFFVFLLIAPAEYNFN